MALNTPMKIVLSLVIIMLIGIGFYLIDYQKKFNDIKTLDTQIVQKQEQLKVSEEKIKRLPVELERKDKLTKELNNLIQEKLPKEDAAIFVPKFIKSVEDLIAYEKRATNDDSLQVLNIAPGALEMPGKDKAAEGEVKALLVFPKQPFQVNLKAKYSTVIHILHQLAALRLQRLVTITRVSLSPSEGARYGMSPSLNVNLPMIAHLNEGKKEEAEPTPAPTQ